MTNPKDCLHKYRRNAINGNGDIVGGEDNYQDMQSDPHRALYLHNLYSAFKASHEGITFRRRTKNPAIIATFNKVAHRLNEYENESGEKIDDSLFVIAQFEIHGKNTYPGHLLGEKAFDIYYEALEKVCRGTVVLREDHDQNLLKYLCEVRGESKEEVMDALENAGLFSPAFIKMWKIAQKRRVH